MADHTNGEKIILKNLNSIINANKKHYESLKFKLVTDNKCRKKPSRGNQKTPKTTSQNPIIKLQIESNYGNLLRLWSLTEANLFFIFKQNKNKFLVFLSSSDFVTISRHFIGWLRLRACNILLTRNKLPLFYFL